MTTTTDLLSNPRFVEFRAELERQGVTLRLLWSTKTGRDPSGKGYDDLGLFSVNYEANAKRPVHRTVFIQDFGTKDGFEMWLDSQTSTFAAGAQEIIAG